MKKKIFEEEIIFDKEAVLEVFIKAKSRLEILNDEIEDAINKGYCFRNGIMVEGDVLEEIIDKMKDELLVLNELFNGIECIKYMIQEMN